MVKKNSFKHFINHISIKYLLINIIFFVILLGCQNMKRNTNWILIWNDEFENDNIDLSKWEHEINAWGGGNKELQYYTDRLDNSYIEDGCLVIQAIKENYSSTEGTREYTSARLRTKYKGDWLYGRIVVRAKLPYGQGIWPAIWMLPTDEVYGGWKLAR